MKRVEKYLQRAQRVEDIFRQIHFIKPSPAPFNELRKWIFLIVYMSNFSEDQYQVYSASATIESSTETFNELAKWIFLLVCMSNFS